MLRKGNRQAYLTLVVIAVFGFAHTQVSAQNSIAASEASSHVGEKQTVCGLVASTHYAARSRGNPTFINLDRPYPNQVFTVLIWGSDRPKFGNPDYTYMSRRICVQEPYANIGAFPR